MEKVDSLSLKNSRQRELTEYASRLHGRRQQEEEEAADDEAKMISRFVARYAQRHFVLLLFIGFLG